MAEGSPTLPDEVSDPLRRRFVKALGATAVVGGTAGCLELLTGPGEPPDDEPDNDVERFEVDWIPKQIIKPIDVQVAYTAEQIFFRFNWSQPDPGGWYHDYIVYEDGEWTRYSNPDPWVAADPDEAHTGFYEDRLSFLLDDGTVRGFENFGGWLTVHAGLRSFVDAASEEDVEEHPYLGEVLERSDVRKFIPQTRTGEWWENPWDDIVDPDELDEMLDDGEFLEMGMWRSHRSDPVGYGTDHYILDYRHGDEGTDTFDTLDWDEETGPEYMYDPDVLEDGALDIEGLRNAEYDQDDPFYIHEDWLVEFDPDVAQWEGAAIPRRPLREPEGSAADWRADGVWADGEWTVEMWRDLDTGHRDNKVLEPGEMYTWAPAVHHGYNARWHWVAYPYSLGLGVEADLRASRVEGDRPEWDEVDTYTLPLVYPGQADWTWLTSTRHRGYHLVRRDEMSIWDVHDDPRRMAAMLLGQETAGDPRK